MYRVNHNKKHLADEFLANPFGRASPELQRVLMVFRGDPPKLLPKHRFGSLEDAERAVFRMRWREHTGHELG
jgi:hypothetical protein